MTGGGLSELCKHRHNPPQFCHHSCRAGPLSGPWSCNVGQRQGAAMLSSLGLIKAIKDFRCIAGERRHVYVDGVTLHEVDHAFGVFLRTTG